MEYLLGNLPFKTAVKNMVKSGNIPNSMLFSGEEGIGKKTAAKYFAAAVMCREKNGVPCGECIPCRKVFSGIHPDVSVMSPDEKGLYRIDRIRDLRSDCAVRPSEADRKIYIIDKAEKMNPASANAFLKCLEDPPIHTVFVLTAEDEKSLIPTVLSRTVRFRISPVGKADFLSRVNDEKKYDLVGGNIGRGQSENSSESVARKIIRAMLTKDGYEFMKCINGEGYMKARETETVLSEMTVIMKNALLYKSGMPVDELSGEVGKKVSESDIYSFLEEISKMRERNTRNVSAQGIFTYLFLNIK